MNRIYFAIPGAFIGACGIALIGSDWLVPAAIFVGGISVVVGGLRERVSLASVRLEWYQLVGGGIMLVGLGNGVIGLRGAVGSGILSFETLVDALNPLLLLFVGTDSLRGGVHHDLSAIG